MASDKYHLSAYADSGFPFFAGNVVEPSLPLHSHDFYEIFTVRSGKAMHLLENESPKPLVPGDIVLLNPFERHGFHVSSGEFILTNCLFSGSLFAVVSAERAEGSPLAPFYLPKKIFRLSRADRARAIALIDTMMHEFKGHQNGYRTAITGILLHLLALIARSSCTSATGRMGTVLAYIDANFTRDVTLTSIADITGLTYSYVSDLFRKTIGCTFKKYLTEKRIRYAVHLLETTDESVSAISRYIGFNDAANFERTFKQYAGRTPLSFRHHTTVPGVQPVSPAEKTQQQSKIKQ